MIHKIKILIFFVFIIILSYNVTSSCLDDVLLYTIQDDLICGEDITLKLIYKENLCSEMENCWEGYKNATLILDENLYTNDKLIKNLHAEGFDAGSWIIKCKSEGVYTVEVILESDSLSCTKNVTLDLTKEEEIITTQQDEDDDKEDSKDSSSPNEDRIEPAQPQESSEKEETEEKPATRSTSRSQPTITAEKDKPNYLIGASIFLIIIITGLIVLYFILRKK